MRKLLILLACLLAGPALADMYPDASNAKLPTARVNLGLGPTASIMDYPGADPTGVTSSSAAFTSCITSGKDCHVPAGTYLLACNPAETQVLYNANIGAAIFGDGAAATILKLPAGCTTPWTVLWASYHRDYTIDVNGAVARPGVGTSIVAAKSGAGPRIERLRIINVPPGRYHLAVMVTGGVNITDPVISGNYLHMTAPEINGNQCVLLSNSGGGTIKGGRVDHNVCVGTAIIAQAIGLSITDNDVSGYNFGSGIVTEASPNSSNYLIARNYIHDGGLLADVNATYAGGIEQWGPDSVMIDNVCVRTYDCIGNGGLRSLIANNRAQDINISNGPAGSAFGARVINGPPAYRADGSMFIGNKVNDSGTGRLYFGYAEQPNPSVGDFTNIVVANNDFNGAPSGRVRYPQLLSPGTKIDVASLGGNLSGEGLIATKSTDGVGVPSFEFTNLDTTSYGTFRLSCSDFQPGAGVTDIAIQVGEGTGPTWITSGYGVALMGTNTGAATASVRNLVSAANVPVNVFPVLTSSALFMNFDVNFGRLGRPGLAKAMTVTAAYPASPASTATTSGTGAFPNSTPVTAVRVISVGGSFNYGACRLYGMI